MPSRELLGTQFFDAYDHAAKLRAVLSELLDQLRFAAQDGESCSEFIATNIDYQRAMEVLDEQLDE